MPSMDDLFADCGDNRRWRNALRIERVRARLPVPYWRRQRKMKTMKPENRMLPAQRAALPSALPPGYGGRCR
ncbi:hypothetical protein C7S13_8387 [Burkholderia cepacia]|nr:hypothetical protein [Burkholderia cepacia]